MNKVFISFSFRDRGFVSNLCENLRLLGLPIWFSLLEIDQNKWLDDGELKRMLEDALKGCDAVMIFVSDHSIGSTWVALELEVARREQYQVIPFVDQMLRIPMPSHIQDHNPIQFNRGYKTALGQLFLRLNPKGKNVKGIAIEDNLTDASRTYANDETLSDRLGQTAIPESVKLFLLTIREFIVTPKHVLRRYYASNASSPSDIWQFALIIAPGYSHVDNIVRGNTMRIPDFKKGQGWTLLFSFLPLFDPNKLSQSPFQTLLISAWPSESNIDGRETISMGIEVREDDSGRIWLASHDGLDRFSLGSSDVDAHLLTFKLKMGAGKYVFQWPLKEPDSKMLASMQRMNNLLGKGMVQTDIDITLRDNGFFDQVRDRLIDQEKFAIPLLGQIDCLWAHLTNGGFFYFAEGSVVPRLISSQIKHFCEAAGGVFLRKEDDASGNICMCIDSYQAHFFTQENG